MPSEQNAVETHTAVYSIKSALKNLSALRVLSARTLSSDPVAHAGMLLGGRGGEGCDYGGKKNIITRLCPLHVVVRAIFENCVCGVDNFFEQRFADMPIVYIFESTKVSCDTVAVSGIKREPCESRGLCP